MFNYSHKSNRFVVTDNFVSLGKLNGIFISKMNKLPSDIQTDRVREIFYSAVEQLVCAFRLFAHLYRANMRT